MCVTNRRQGICDVSENEEGLSVSAHMFILSRPSVRVAWFARREIERLALSKLESTDPFVDGMLRPSNEIPRKKVVVALAEAAANAFRLGVGRRARPASGSRVQGHRENLAGSSPASKSPSGCRFITLIKAIDRLYTKLYC